MSRSWKTHAIAGWASAKSEREDKKIWHRRFRTKSRLAAASLIRRWDPDADWDACFADIHVRAVSNRWDMAKDGKGWIYSRGLSTRRRGFFRRPLVYVSCWKGIQTVDPKELHLMLGK